MTASEIYDFSPSTLKIARTIHGSNIAFVIDTSDTIPNNLELIKAITIELIDIFMCQIGSYSFNVISFADTYSKLSNVLLPFCKSTATLASDWIQTLNCDTSKNTLLALGTAYTDNDVDDVIMLTDGLMNQKSPELVRCVSELSQGRPLHIIYMNEESEDDNILDFLQTLAACTDGTLHSVKQQSRCVLEDEQIYPDDAEEDVHFNCSSSELCSSDEESIVHEEEKENGEDEEVKLLGKAVLAKRNINGYYYKGTIIKTTSSSEDVVVLFDSSKDKSVQLQQSCTMSELIFYDEAKEEKIYPDDKILVNLDGKKRFIPATVLKKEYIFDDAAKDDVRFTKVLEAELINGDVKNIPISSAIHIPIETYERIVNGIKDQKSVKKSGDENDKGDTTTDEVGPDTVEDISKGLLRDKIERQLRESEDFLRSLNTKAKEEISYNGDCSASSSDRYLKKSIRKFKNHYWYEDGDSSAPPTSTPKPTSGYHSSYDREKHCRFTEPHPPTSWNSSVTKMKRSSCANPRTMRRSASVGCNVVELSKKHWKGRPTSKEISPKRPFKDRYIIKPTIGMPSAEEYQTTDGVPFPVRTDNKFRRAKRSNWTPDAEKPVDFIHHDIIGHRIVKPNRTSDQLYSYEENEEKRINARRSKQKMHKERQAEINEARRKELEARDEQVRQQIEDRVKDEFSKLRIDMEKNDGVRKAKLHKQEEHRKFEREREGMNQTRKYTRIAARKEKMKNYMVAEEERATDPETRDQQVQTVRRLKSERRSEFERTRIEKQIEDHESKINRLKQLRRNTEARFRSMRKENDNHRDITSHVKDQQEGIARASILP